MADGSVATLPLNWVRPNIASSNKGFMTDSQRDVATVSRHHKPELRTNCDYCTCTVDILLVAYNRPDFQ
jgi:hypothetical protein